MQLDLLKRRAENLSSVSNTSLPHRLRVIPGLNFSCAGSITSLLLVARIQTVADNRNSYPEVQIWKTVGQGFMYEKQASQEIRLAAGDFSPDGVLQYNLTTPLPFQIGDMLGVWQPEESQSVVQLFYANDPTATVACTEPLRFNFEIINVQGLTKVENQSLLLLPMTSE